MNITLENIDIGEEFDEAFVQAIIDNCKKLKRIRFENFQDAKGEKIEDCFKRYWKIKSTYATGETPRIGNRRSTFTRMSLDSGLGGMRTSVGTEFTKLL